MTQTAEPLSRPASLRRMDTMTNALATYDQARHYLATCAKVDEVKAIRDKAEALRVYARQTNDLEMECWTTEIKLRASRRMGEISKALEKAKPGGGGQNGKGKEKFVSPSGGLTKKDVLEAAGITKQEANRAERIFDIPEEEFDAYIGEKKKQKAPPTYREVIARVPTRLKRSAKQKKNAKLVQEAPKLTSLLESLAGEVFPTVVIDPPWDWGDEGDVSQFGRGDPTYSTMPLEELADPKKFPLGELADDNAHLYLWITNRSLPKGFGLMESWGFRYITCLTWCKPCFGMGNYFRGSTEQILFGVRGSLSLLRKDVGTWFTAERGKRHSSKPEAFYKLVEECSPGPWLELFQRTPRNGWTGWGAEVP